MLLGSFTKKSVRIAFTEVGGLSVSTVKTSDLGLETAIIDKLGTYPVERYESKKEAEVGHLKWVARAEKGLTSVTMLGYMDVVPDKIKNLVPREKKLRIFSAYTKSLHGIKD